MTPNQQTLLDLATRAEGVAGADDLLDIDICAALVGAEKEWQEHRKAWAFHRDGRWVSIGPIVPYTASLDQALTLVPEGWRLWTGDFSVIGRFVWMLVGSPAPWADPEDGSEHITPQYVAGIGAQSAPAMVSAALRARAAQCAS